MIPGTRSLASELRLLAPLAGVLFLYSTAEAFSIDVASGTVGQFTPVPQSFNETRGVDVTVLAGVDLQVSSMTLNGFFVGNDGMADVGARIYASPSGTLLAASNTTVFANGSVTLAISATLVSGQSYRICFFAGPLGPGGDNSGTMFDPAPSGVGGFPYVESTGSLVINQAYALAADAFPTNQNIFVPLIVIEANSGQTGLEDAGRVQPLSRIYPASPNPFRSSTSFRFELSSAAPVEAGILDVSGRMIRVLANSTTLMPGSHTLGWDGRNDRGRRVAAGVYFFRLEAGSSISTYRLEFLR